MATETTMQRAERLEEQFRLQRRAVIEAIVGDNPTIEQAQKIHELTVQIVTCEMIQGVI